MGDAMPKPVVSAASLRLELRKHLGDIGEMVPVAEEEESRAFAFRRADEDFIARVNRSDQGFRKEAFVFARFASAALPVPEVMQIGVLESGDFYCISRRLPGVTLQDLATDRLTPVLLEAVTIAMAAIERTDLEGTERFGPFGPDGVGSHDSWQDFLTSVADPARYDWAAVDRRAEAVAVRRILDVVRHSAEACPEIRRLVHGDFGSNNVLTDGSRITGLIDWSEALFGDPLYDVANILFWRPWLDCMEQQARYFEGQRTEFLEDTERLLCYQLRIGLEEIYQNAVLGHRRLVVWAIDRSARIMGHAPD